MAKLWIELLIFFIIYIGLLFINYIYTSSIATTSNTNEKAFYSSSITVFIFIILVLLYVFLARNHEATNIST
jgi:hypothetical protein